MGLVLPTDNAVIDYSILNQIISILNQHQAVINQIQPTNTSGGTPSIPKVVGGVSKATSGPTSKTFTVNLPISGITTPISYTATAYSSSGAAYCWISSINSSRVIFSTNIAVPAIYWMAYGTA